MNVHVIFGAGQVGSGLARLLAAEGHAVRVVRRSTNPVAPGVEVVAADARVPEAVLAATEGATVLYHCMNPSAYTAATWETEFPALGEALIAATLARGARLVCLDNLYPYGETATARTEETPQAGTGRKALVRIAWERRLRQAADELGLRWTMGRAGDFVGPGTADQSLFSTALVRRLAAGKTAWVVGDPDAVHAFGYVPDVVKGLAALGRASADVEGRSWHLPVLSVSPRDLVRAMAAAAGHEGRARALPGWAIRALAPVVPLFAELRETLYQWEQPFMASDAAFRARFPGLATPLGFVAEQTVAGVQPRSLPLAARPAV
jgi:nucleoside-diphosphate-sugar epimerase